jgi:hypothetical protein
LEKGSARELLLPVVIGNGRGKSVVGEGEATLSLSNGLGEELPNSDGFAELDGRRREWFDGGCRSESSVLTGETPFAGVGEDVLATARFILIGGFELRNSKVREGEGKKGKEKETDDGVSSVRVEDLLALAAKGGRKRERQQKVWNWKGREGQAEQRT